ncbi:sulfite exporter TauE/SafE family protein [Myxococcota bacterium]|nr:sulfite exporter TauE/SafE family protein [Myxococcota bacterium]MBU1534920.1 sulfite exporter TauE/SafE family protein [Myxococcota bacterium]
MSVWWAAFTSLWLGILVSISPCPLATNIAAVSFVGRRMNRPRSTLLAGISYALGRMAFYVLLTALFLVSVSSMPVVAHFLQKWFPMIVGPVLILTGMFLVELITLPTGRGGAMARLTERLGAVPFLGAFLLGFVFAASFCPVSGAIYFGSFLPVAMTKSGSLIYALLFGLGTALPVLVFATVAACSGSLLGRLFKTITGFEKKARYVTGTVLILLGIYLSSVTVWSL